MTTPYDPLCRDATEENPLRVKFSYRLACGHVLNHGFASSPATKDGIRQAAAGMEYWLLDRAARHDCGLVSPENPSGNYHAS